MTKVVIERLGTASKLIIFGENGTEITEKYYLFYNHNGTSSELFWIDPDKIGCCYTSPGRFQRALVSICFFRLLRDGDKFLEDHPESTHPCKGQKGGVIKEARKMARDMMPEFELLPGERGPLPTLKPTDSIFNVIPLGKINHENYNITEA